MAGNTRLWCGLGLLLAAGCAAPVESSGQLVGRLNTAREITATGPRQQAMAEVATDAADSGQADISLQALDGIDQPALRTRTAEACAASMDRQDRRDKADEMVARIPDEATRNRIREGYAANPAPVEYKPH